MLDGELMFAVLDVPEVFSRPHIVLPKEHSLDAVFFSPPLSLCFPPLSPSLLTLCNSLKLAHAYAAGLIFLVLMYNDDKDLIHSCTLRGTLRIADLSCLP